jgi:hypothetical protein
MIVVIRYLAIARHLLLLYMTHIQGIFGHEMVRTAKRQVRVKALVRVSQEDTLTQCFNDSLVCPFF